MNFVIGVMVAVIALVVVDSCSIRLSGPSRFDQITYNRGVGFEHKSSDGEQYFQNPR